MWYFLGHSRGVIYTFFRRFFFWNILSLLIPPERKMLSRTSHTCKDTANSHSLSGGGIVMISPANVYILCGKIILLVWLPFMSAAWLDLFANIRSSLIRRERLRHRCWWNPSGSNLDKGTIREIVLSLALQWDRQSHRINPLALHQWPIGYIFRDATSCSRLPPGARLAARTVKTME